MSLRRSTVDMTGRRIRDPEAKTVCARSDPEIGGAVPMSVWHRRVLRVSVSPRISGDALADHMESEDFRALIRRVIAGHRVEWDGSNHVGQIDEDGEDALDAIGESLEQFGEDDLTQIWLAGDYLFRGCTLAEVWPKDKTIEEAVTCLEVEARSNNLEIDGDIHQEIVGEARRYVEEEKPGLSIRQVDTLVAAGEIDAEQADEYKREHCCGEPALERGMSVVYTHEGKEFQAEITRIESGVIYAKTLQPNGDYTAEHDLPLPDIVRTIGGIDAPRSDPGMAMG